ncbi:hypothetical protein EPO33_03795 [Patescibacteria group bacterium]|nr:MAG: hypothetical protein EPO33_03795 [Patescibacteria group bacterium]
MLRPIRIKLTHPYAVATLVCVTVVLLIGTAALGARALERRWKNLILPGITAGGIPLGEKTLETGAIALAETFDANVGAGFRFTSPTSETIVPAELVGIDTPDQTRTLVQLDADATARAAMAVGHGGNILQRAADAVRVAIDGHEIPLIVRVSRQDLISALAEKFQTEETPVVDAGLRFEKRDGRSAFAVVTARPGKIYDYNAAVNTLEAQLAEGDLTAIPLTLREAAPAVGDAAVAALIPEAERLLGRGSITLKDPEGETWEITPDTFAGWIAVEADAGAPHLGFSTEAMAPFFDGIAAEVGVEAVDARFRIENGRVVEFAPSRDGITVDHDATAANLWQALQKGETEAALVRTVEKPRIATGEANGLGITDKLGTGVSRYAGSPRNRIRNINNAIRKLNGILIQPGETFSLIAALQPFTLEGGWLPELVIKGDKIVPEIGGGACQIGTTTFRMAMNSGMPIVERQNHSLVVSYYNDLANGNPGTDATIYEPSPDFKFLNDSGNIMLFEAVNDSEKQMLYFTLWGTADGRKGSYTPPVVHNWIGAGPEKIVETTDLAPGERNCQAGHTGAVTSFTYEVTLPDGSKKEQVFTSRYRALPRICLVGVAAAAPPPEEPALGSYGPGQEPSAPTP